MLGRLTLHHSNVAERIRCAGSLYRMCIHSHWSRTGILQIKSRIRYDGRKIFHHYSLRISGKSCPRFTFLQRLSIGLCSATGIKLLISDSSSSFAAAQSDIEISDVTPDENVATFDWGKFWLMLKPHLWHLIAAIASALVVAILNIRIPLMLGHVVNVIGDLLLSDRMNLSYLIEEMERPATHLISLYLGQAFFTFMYIYLMACVGERVATTMKLELFASIMSQDLAFFDKHRTGDIVSRLTVDIQDFKSSFKLCISQGIRSITQIVGCSISLCFISPQMAGGMLVIVPVIILIGSGVGSLLRNISVTAQAQASRATLVCEQAIGNIRTVRAFAMEFAEYERFAKEVQDSCSLNERLAFGIGLFQGATNLFLNGLVLSTLFVGSKLMANGQLAAGDLMAFLAATQTIQRSLAQLSLLFGFVAKGMAAGARVFAFINLTPDMPLTGGKKIPFHSLLGEITFKNVSFSYPTRQEQKILDNFSLWIAPGSTIALVGSSGNGKSTIAALLERFYDVDKGSITIDNIDIRELDPSWLRGKAIGLINQEPILFAGSVMENIRYGKWDATDEEVIEVAKLANADEFIRSFPDGYDTVVGERGVTVSGGQKQRIAIARALIKNPSILILDEATSALDTKSEKLVQDALNTLTRGRTVLIIAHRLSTVMKANLIVVLSNGEIVEMGTHDDLIEKKGFYWNLFHHQRLQGSPRAPPA